MSWPVLGAKRVQEKQAAQPAKKQKIVSSRNNLKFDTLFRGKGLPQEVEALVMGYATPLHYQLCEKKYGKQLAVYNGQLFVSDWHPRIQSTTRARHGWSVFDASRINTTFAPLYIQLLPMPPIEQCTADSMRPLVGKQVLIRYKNAAGKVTIMSPKFVIEVFHGSMAISDNDPRVCTDQFTISYKGILSLDLFVDVKIGDGVARSNSRSDH